MDKSIRFKNVLPVNLFFALHDRMQDNWMLSNANDNYDNKISWGANNKYDLPFIKAGIHIKYKIKKYLKQEISLCKIHTNGQTTGQGSKFHIDFEWDCFWTFVLFTSPAWDVQWGGEFVCFNPKKQDYEYTTYVPNTGVLVQSNWLHCGRSPNTHTSKLRTTLAFSFISTEAKKTGSFNNLLDNY